MKWNNFLKVLSSSYCRAHITSSPLRPGLSLQDLFCASFSWDLEYISLSCESISFLVFKKFLLGNEMILGHCASF